MSAAPKDPLDFIKTKAERKSQSDAGDGVTLSDFYAYMPLHN